jgi:hypothetical protein
MASTTGPIPGVARTGGSDADRWSQTSRHTVVDELTGKAGLVTSEMVPAMAAIADGARRRGGLRLAGHRF